jgi:hypothetical protein
MTVTLTINVDSDTRLTREQLLDINGKLNETCSSMEDLKCGFITAEFAVDGETFSYDEIQDYEGLSENDIHAEEDEDPVGGQDSDPTAQK